MDAVEQLTADLRYGNLPERRAALAALAERGPAALPAVADLIPALRDADDEVRERAAGVLTAIGTEAVPALLAALLPDDAVMRCAVVRVLGRMGPVALDAVPVLTAALRDPRLKEDAAWALGEIQGRPLLDLRQRLRQVAPALAVVVGAYVMVMLCVWLFGSKAAAPPAVQLRGQVAAAVAVLGAGLGALLGSAWGRQGAVAGFLACGMTGYLFGLLVGTFVESILGPLSSALR
jgi:HEAT repeat protein